MTQYQDCTTCEHYRAMRGTYGLCRPAKMVTTVPFWATKFSAGQQTNVRPDEGARCSGHTGKAA